MLNCVLIFLDMSGGELILIALVALLVLGPQKMGDFARKAGKMMNEVKRVSSDFTDQFNDETGSVQNEVRSIRDTIKDAANNIKGELNAGKQEVDKNLDSSEKESHLENVIKEIPSEHSGTQHVTTEQQVDNKPTSNQENNINP